MSRGLHSSRAVAACIWLAAGLVAALVHAIGPAIAVQPADLARVKQTIDLAPYFAGLETEVREIAIERPDTTTGLNEFMTLIAKGPGPRFRWIAMGFVNSDAERRDMVVVVPNQGFVGSGLDVPRPLGSPLAGVEAAGAVKLEPLAAAGKDAYALSLEGGQSGAVAFEMSGPTLKAASLWRRGAYDNQKDYLAFFRGALLGIAVLLTVAMTALYGFRARAVFLAAGGFGLASVAFMLLEGGHIPSLLQSVGIPAVSLVHARAVIEGVMAALLVLLLVTISDMRRIWPVTGNVLAVLGALTFAVPVYGFAEPLLASAIARGIFVATSVIGFGLVFKLWRDGENKAETSLIPWSAILLWTFLAVVAAASDPGNGFLSPLLLSGLCAVLVVLAFTLAHYAFSQGYLSRHFFREAGRRALALAGARAYVWDWQPEDGDLHVSEELERVLGQPQGLLADAGVEAFLELMHPSDRTAYLGAVEDVANEGRGVIEKEFRLRHGDGTYRWFQLRARAMQGQAKGASRCIGTLSDVTAAKRAEERLLSDAVYDRVTGLPNRALLIDRLSRAIATAQDGGSALPHVLLVDVDRFKVVNDGLGHDVGDGLLAVLGKRLTAEAGQLDTVARLPGDQFAVLFVDPHGGRDLGHFTDRIRKTIARPINLEGQEIFLTASIGLVQASDPGIGAEQYMKNAALALYEAKRKGSDTVEVFHDSMRDDRAELVVLEQELRRAIERDEIEVHYQPIARLADMNLAGFEALVRWRHPSLGLLAPESFIGLAEQTGMIKDIGRAVLNEAGRQLGIWQRAFRPAEPIFIAVNMSSAQLIDAEIVDAVKLVLHREGLRRGSLKIEVTESLVMEYPEHAIQILDRFRELGVGISCDDFGTGYSSLSSLRKLPFDTLKVDQSFIHANAEEMRAGVILEAIIAMAHALGLTVVAEGIENQEQVDVLGLLACDFGQGFFIGKPMTAKQVTESLNGLPYAPASERTAITWLWERAARDAAPEPSFRNVSEAHEPASSPRPETSPPPPEPELPARAPAAVLPPGLAPLAPRLPRFEAKRAAPNPESKATAPVKPSPSPASAGSGPEQPVAAAAIPDPPPPKARKRRKPRKKKGKPSGVPGVV